MGKRVSLMVDHYNKNMLKSDKGDMLNRNNDIPRR